MTGELRDIAAELESHERGIIIFTLVNMLVFYLFTVGVFLTARKSRVNTALAVQKFLWMLLIAFIALPAYALSTSVLPGWGRVFLWGALTIASWVVLYEVYRANWHDSFRAYFWHVACNVLGFCRIDRHR